MKKYYLIDSENVGDVWVPLLVASQEDEVVLVFYTQRSPHMNYENVRLLKETEKEAVFIKCFEGNNALDFQLVSELGFLLREDSESEYVIVSNDMGFDAVVRYWAAKGMLVSRLSGKECYRKFGARKKQEEYLAVAVEEKEQEDDATVVSLEIADEGHSAVVEACLDAIEIITDEEQKSEAKEISEEISVEPVGECEEFGEIRVIKDLCQCIAKEDLVDFHNALVALLGTERGKALYQEIKGNAEYTTYWSALPKISQKEKFDIYCKLVFAYSEFAADAPENFADFLIRSNGKRKNLNSLRAALLSEYGKDKGMRYYSLFKSHIKIMNRMQ